MEENKTEEKPGLINKAADILSYPVSVAAGIFTFISSVNDKLYDTLKKNKTGLGEELDRNKEDFRSESPPAYAGGFTLVQASLGHNLPALVFLYNAV
ncbi:MAG: hypothetical protein R3D71_07880 [Rickettsiales bacterium]